MSLTGTTSKQEGASSSVFPVYSENSLSLTYDVPVTFKFHKNEVDSQDSCPVVILPKSKRYITRCNVTEDDKSKECYAILVAEETLSAKDVTIAPLNEEDTLLGIEVLIGGRKKGDMIRLAADYDIARLTNYPENFKWAYLVYDMASNPYATYQSPFFSYTMTLRFHFRQEKSYISRCYDGLLKKQVGCDVHFDFKNGETFGAHLPILIARSPVFAAMFEHDMVESRSKRINVCNENPETFKMFLYYLYSGDITKLPSIEDAMELYGVANLYQTEDLKNLMVNHLKANVSKKRAIQLLIFADQYSVQSLKEASLKVIAQNGKEVCSSAEWEDLARRYPELGILVTRRILGINVSRPPRDSSQTASPKRARTA